MERYKRLTNHSIILGNNFYSLDLYAGKTNLPDTRDFYCFFIVNHPCSEESIHEQALQLLMTPCRNFNFYGAYSKQWDIGFDWIDYTLHPGDDDMEIAFTNQWDDLDQFVEELHLVLSMRSITKFDVYLIYDDVSLYCTVLEQLLAYENIRRHHSDWWEIVTRMKRGISSQ